MNSRVLEELVEEMISSIEALESHTTATLQLLKAEGIASEEKLAPHLEQARAASSVRARATRVRLQHLISSAVKEEERAANKSQEQAGEKHHDDDAAGASQNNARATEQAAELAKPQSEDTETSGQTPEQRQSVTSENAAQQRENRTEPSRKADIEPGKDGTSSPSETVNNAA